MNKKYLIVTATAGLLLPCCTGVFSSAEKAKQELDLAPESLVGKTLVVDGRGCNFEFNLDAISERERAIMMSFLEVSSINLTRTEYRFVSDSLFYMSGREYKPPYFRWSYKKQDGTKGKLLVYELDGGHRVYLNFDSPTSGTATVHKECFLGTDTDNELVIKEASFTLK